MKRSVLLVVCVVSACAAPDASDSTDDTALVIKSGSLAITRVELSQTPVGRRTQATLAIQNTSRRTSGAIAVAVGGGQFAIASTTCGAPLAPEASCEVAIEFRPTTAGAHAGTLTVDASPGRHLAIELAGDAFVPALHFEPAALDFGLVEVGLQTTRTVELRNDGDTAVPLDALETISVGGTISHTTTCGNSLAAATGCTIEISVTLDALAPLAADLLVISAGESFEAGIAGHGAFRLTLERTGDGGVISNPVGIDCGTQCSALFTTDLELVPTGFAGPVVTWSTCGTVHSCYVPASTSPVTISVTFSNEPPAEVGFDVAATGDPGGVEVRFGSGGAGIFSNGGMSTSVVAGTEVEIVARGPGPAAQITGACIGTGSCTFIPTLQSHSVLVTFPKAVAQREEWSFDLGSSDVQAIEFDGSGNLVVGATFDSDGLNSVLNKFAPNGTWTDSKNINPILVTDLTTGPDDTIYVHSGTHVHKFDALLNLVWSQPIPITSQGAAGAYFQHRIAVGPDGAVAVRGSNSVSWWSADGLTTWTRAVDPYPIRTIAIDSAGVVHTTVENINGEQQDAVRFAANGTSLPPIQGLCDQAHGMITTDPFTGNVICTSSGHSNVYGVGVVATSSPDYVETTIAGTGIGHRGWLFHLDNDTDYAWRFTRHAADGSTLWTILGDAYFDNDFIRRGVEPSDIAGSATGRLAVAGRYYWFGGHSAYITSYAP